MPVLPDVGSTIVAPGLSRPFSSASSIMARAMRSLTLPPGLRDSTFASTSAEPSGTTRLSRTSGVLPMRSRALAAMPLSCGWFMTVPILDRVARYVAVAFLLREVGDGVALKNPHRRVLYLLPDGADTTAGCLAAAVGVLQTGDGSE